MKRTILALALLLSPLAALAQPTEVKVIMPHFPVWRQSQEPLDFDVEGPSGLAPQLQLGGRPVPLEEVAPGKFHARLSDIASSEQTVTLNGQPLGLVRTLSGPRQVVEVSRDQAIFRSGPDPDFDRYTPVAAGVRLEVIGRQGDWLHVSPPDAYIHEKDVKTLAPGSSLWPARVRSVRVREQPDGSAEVRVRLFHPCAWQIREEPELGRLWVDFPGVPMTMHETAFAQDARRIPAARLHPSPQSTQLELMVADGLWGYQARWEQNELVLRLAPPIWAASRPLEGVRVTVDAGHGGTDMGAPGPGGSHEKEHNFAVALALQKQLEEAGAVVTMTRSEDREVIEPRASADQELSARVQVAEKSGAQLFISVHHNAMANLEAGRKAHGCHVYYYHPHSRAMAQAVARPTAEAIGESSYLHFWRSFHLTRQSGMPAILIECNFVSNPQVEKEMLQQPDYGQKAAAGILKGLRDFLRATAPQR